ncbi:MAG: TraB/GumN family protein, partial [Novosphingobium sp.]
STASGRRVFSKRGGLLAALLALILTSCAKPAEVRPALWLVEGPNGQKAWLFGTIHALPARVDWRSPKVDAALEQSDRLLVEVAKIDDDAETARAFAALNMSPGLPPLADRVAPELRGKLAEELRDDKFAPGDLDKYETWAAALLLQNAAMAAASSDVRNGIDRQLIAASKKPVEEFEGAAAQLAIFDRLSEPAQRSLLAAMLTGDADEQASMRKLEQAWAHGDLAVVEAETEGEFAGNPELRDALLVRRNLAWTRRLVGELGSGAHPFVAVGLAHMAGKDGLPVLLAQRGYKVTRLQ